MRSWQQWNCLPRTWIFSLCALAVACILGRPLVQTRLYRQQPSSHVPQSCRAEIEGHRFSFPTLAQLCHGEGRDCVITVQLTLRSAKDLDAEGENNSRGQGEGGLHTPCRVYAVVDHGEHAGAEALPEQQQQQKTHAVTGGGGKDPVWDFTFTLSMDARTAEEALLTVTFLCEDDAGDLSDHHQMRIGSAEVPVAHLLGGKGYARSRMSGEIMATAQVLGAAGEPCGLLFYSYSSTVQQPDGPEAGTAGLDALQADQLMTLRDRAGFLGFIIWLIGRVWGGVTGGVLGFLQRVLSLVWGVGSNVWGVALGLWPIIWLAVQGILDIVAALWYLVYMLGALVVMGVWSLLSMIFGGRRDRD